MSRFPPYGKRSYPPFTAVPGVTDVCCFQSKSTQRTDMFCRVYQRERVHSTRCITIMRPSLCKLRARRVVRTHRRSLRCQEVCARPFIFGTTLILHSSRRNDDRLGRPSHGARSSTYTGRSGTILPSMRSTGLQSRQSERRHARLWIRFRTGIYRE